jgi:hypothetical protein
MVGVICVLALGVMGCGETAGTGGRGGTAGNSGVGGDGGTGGAGGTGGTGVPAGCPPLAEPDPGSTIIDVDPSEVGNLTGIVSSAKTGDTIRFASGTYDLDGVYMWISTPGVTLRSASGNRDDVVLDGNYQSTEIITVAASDVTIADLTIREAATHPIHVVSTDSADTINTLIYNVHIVDPREQAIKINPSQGGYFVDDGEIACSHIELTDTGRPNVQPNPGGCYTGGVDAHQASGWVIRDNVIEGFWCNTGLSEHAVHCWRGCRDTVVERNVLLNNARAVGFGLATSGAARTYSGDPCPGVSGYVGHYNGIVRNNFIFANDSALLSSPDGFDCGICFWSACGARALHNSIVSTGDNFSSIEWRFSTSAGVEITNNIVTHPLRERDGASATVDGNLESAQLSLFVDGQNGNLHLDPGASAAIDQGVMIADGLSDDDIDGDARDVNPDIGADEVR